MKEKNNLHLIDILFETNAGKSITIKNSWEAGNLLSQKRDIVHLAKNFLITPKR